MRKLIVKASLVAGMIGLMAVPANAAVVHGRTVGSSGCGVYTTDTYIAEPGGPLVAIGTAGADFSNCLR